MASLQVGESAGVTILCVDADPHQLHAYRELLAKRGYRVAAFDNGSEALRELSRVQPQLILTDLALPGLSGHELIQQLRHIPDSHGVPVFVVSEESDESTISQALQNGAEEFFGKPIRASELTAKISMALKKRELAALSDLGFPLGSLFNGRYRIVKSLGGGGFSSVYYATDVTQEPELPVALKVFDFPAVFRKNIKFTRLFLREAYEHSIVEHDNIVKLLDFGQFGRAYYLAMEYVDGLSLDEILNISGPIPEGPAMLIGHELAQALQYLDGKGMLHRDIKPRNIMIAPNGDPILLDFGLARRQNDDTLSFKDEFKGTPHFVSPEYILRESKLDIRTDIYSLGVTLYYALSRKLPIDGKSPVQVIHNHLTVVPTSLRDLGCNVSAEFGGLIDRMLEKDRFARPTVDELVDEFRVLLCDSEEEA